MISKNKFAEFFLIVVSILTAGAFSSALAQALTGEQIVGRIVPSVAVVLVGDDSGAVTKVGSGVFVRADGVLLTAYHLVKDAKTVQVRLKSGDVFDRVSLLGVDERRDIAALKIQAADMPVLPVSGVDDLKPGEAVYVVSHPTGLNWSAANGVLSAVRLADEVPGAGQGFRVIQFTAPVSAGSSGGVLVDAQGRALGVIVGALAAGQNLNFAVPIANVKGLADVSATRTFNSGGALAFPRPNNEASAGQPAKAVIRDPRELLLNSRTVYVDSNTSMFKSPLLINEMNKRAVIKDWGWLFLGGDWEARKKADLIIELDHQVFTFNFTYKISHRETSIVIASGKAIIADGGSGAPIMVDNIIKKLLAVRAATPRVAERGNDR